jgi:hypothetical protein
MVCVPAVAGAVALASPRSLAALGMRSSSRSYFPTRGMNNSTAGFTPYTAEKLS